MGVLFKNVLKGLSKRKGQVLGVILLVMLTTVLYVGVNAATLRLEDTYYDYIKTQKVEDYAIGFDTISIESEIFDTEDKREDVCTILGLAEPSRCRNISETAEEINNEISIVDGQIKNKVLEVFEKYYVPYYESEYDVKIESASYKNTTDNGVYHYFSPVNSKVNLPYVENGRLPESDGEVTLSPVFAKENNIKIGDEYKVNIKVFDYSGTLINNEEHTYKVVGTAYISNKMMGLDSMTLLPDLSKETAVLITENDYNKISLQIEDYRVYSVNDTKNTDINKLDEELNEKEIGSVLNFRQFETNSIKSEIKNNKVTMKVFSLFVVVITVIVIAFILKKRIENEATQIGILKALGYRNKEISVGYLAFPITSALIGIILGTIVGQIIALYFVNMYTETYTMPIGSSWFSLDLLIYSAIIPFLIIVIVSFICVLYLLNIKVMDLLKPTNKHNVALETPKLNFEKRNLGHNIFEILTFPFKIIIYVIKSILDVLSKIILKLIKPFKFKTRFKYSLAIRSLGRLIVMGIVVFFASVLMIFALFSGGMVNNLINDTFDQYKYDYYSIYGIPRWDDRADTESILFVSGGNIVKINDIEPSEYIKEEQLVTISDDHFEGTNFQLNGVDSDMKYQEFLDKDKNNILSKLFQDSTSNTLIIPSAISLKYHLDEGDTLTLDIEGYEVKYVIAGIFIDSFNTNQVFVSRTNLINTLSEKIDMELDLLADVGVIPEEVIQEAKDSKDKFYTAVYGVGEAPNDGALISFSLTDLKAEVDSAMEYLNMSIYIIVAVAAFISMIVIVVMTGFTVEDNFKNISLLKVMGYKNKEIVNMTLLVYAPVIIISFLLAIPFTYAILKILIYILTSLIGFEFPVRLEFLDLLIGLVAIVTIYVISLLLAYRSLKKVSLQEALKEE